MKIERATDWQEVKSSLLKQMRSIGYNPDFNKMIKNIDSMITALSKIEVEARRIRKSKLVQNQLEDINKAIDHLEKLLLMAQLMK
jgi:hypothetical protein